MRYADGALYAGDGAWRDADGAWHPGDVAWRYAGMLEMELGVTQS